MNGLNDQSINELYCDVNHAQMNKKMNGQSLVSTENTDGLE